jgi:hypothetical protein
MKNSLTTLKNGRVRLVIRDQQRVEYVGKHEGGYCKSYDNEYLVREIFDNTNTGEQRVLLESFNSNSRNPVSSYWLSNSSNPIQGNGNPNLTAYNGWRGTTNNVAVYAHGLREVISVKMLGRGCGVSILLSENLTPNE